ncbi:Non-specific serine/threonine protein kinase [Microcystis aeruginosa]
MKDIEQIRRQLIERYQQLSALDQVIVRLFSLIYEPIARSTFLDCLNQAHYRDENNRRFNGQTLKSHLDILLEAEVITQDKGYGLRCHPLLVEIASRDSVSKGEFKRFAEIIKNKLPQNRTRWHENLVFQGKEQLIREIRLAIYRQDFDYDNPFDLDWLRTQPTKFQSLALNSILVKAFEKITRADGAFSLLEELCQDQTSVSEAHLWLEQAIIRRQGEQVHRYLDRPFPESQPAEIGLPWRA